MAANTGPEYVFSGRGNYGGPEVTVQGLVDGYNSGPPCHNLGHYIQPVGRVVMGGTVHVKVSVNPVEAGDEQAV